MTGFVSMLDRPKSLEEKGNEVWTKIFGLELPE